MGFIPKFVRELSSTSGNTAVDSLVNVSKSHARSAVIELDSIRRGGEGEDFLRHVEDMFRSVSEAKGICHRAEHAKKCELFVDDATDEMSLDITNRIRKLHKG